MKLIVLSIDGRAEHLAELLGNGGELGVCVCVCVCDGKTKGESLHNCPLYHMLMLEGPQRGTLGAARLSTPSQGAGIGFDEVDASSASSNRDKLPLLGAFPRFFKEAKTRGRPPRIGLPFEPFVPPPGLPIPCFRTGSELLDLLAHGRAPRPGVHIRSPPFMNPC